MSWRKSLEEFSTNFANIIKDGITDVTKLDVTTVVGDSAKVDMEKVFGDKENFTKDNGTSAELTIIGMTRINAAGDIVEMLYGSNGKLDMEPDLLEIHKENVKQAVETWNRFFRNLLEISATVAAIIDPKSERIDLIRALKTNIEPLGKKPVDDQSPNNK